jgi:BlaI family transcriptional regulator, penicillinase repressor
VANHPANELSRRERQIMDIVYQRGRATVAEVRAGLPSPPGYSAVRALLAILVDKGWLKHESDGPRYVYSPTRPRGRAGTSAIKRVLETFYEGSVEQAVAALLKASDSKLSDDELDRIGTLIDKARREGR